MIDGSTFLPDLASAEPHVLLARVLGEEEVEWVEVDAVDALGHLGLDDVGAVGVRRRRVRLPEGRHLFRVTDAVQHQAENAIVVNKRGNHTTLERALEGRGGCENRDKSD